MSLGTGASKVTGEQQPLARWEVSMATLKQEPPQRAAANRHRHTE